MNRLGIETGLDLKARSLSFLQQHFGKLGPYFYSIARGIDDRPVRADQIRESIGAENTFSVDLFTFEAARDALLPIIDRVWRHCEISGNQGRTVTLKIKYADFQQITRSRSLARIIEERTALERIGLDLLKAQFPVAKRIRLLGISLSTLLQPIRATQNSFRLESERIAVDNSKRASMVRCWPIRRWMMKQIPNRGARFAGNLR
jgi:DNA polymerase-4